MDRVITPILNKWIFRIKCLEFRMINIKDERGELIRYRIPRKDLFLIQEKIIKSEVYKSCHHETWNQGRITNYLIKGVAKNSILDKSSSARILYLVNVVNWHMKIKFYENSIFIINNRPWFNIYNEYAKKYNIDLKQVRNVKKFNKEYLYKFLRSNILLYGISRYIKYKNISIINGSEKNKNQLYIDGRGDVHLKNDGNHSDFFWYFNSDFPSKKILYTYYSNKEKIYLKENGINVVPEGVVFARKILRNYAKPKIKFNYVYKDESRVLKKLLDSYDIERYYWGNFFKKNNIKIYFTWNIVGSNQMAIADAVKDCGGISVVWQLAFQGFTDVVMRQDYDISFCYSKFSHKIDKESGSKNKYTVITGYPRDYASRLVKKEAAKVRQQIIAHGAKKIIFAIDENSTDDSRWHTGHILQRENYSYILEKVLETPWLGVIFKPKNAKSLRYRLGSINDLLEKVKKTGRCYIYENTGRHTTKEPPVLAALSSDLCIAGHIGGGTAALECALAGLPTLLIDREGCLESELYKLPEGKVIFKDWVSTIDAVVEHFNSPGGIDGFGDWSSIIDDLDPFRDGNASKRIGDYLNWIIQGFDEGLDRSTVMAEAAEKYRQQWGNDKVVVL